MQNMWQQKDFNFRTLVFFIFLLIPYVILVGFTLEAPPTSDIF